MTSTTTTQYYERLVGRFTAAIAELNSAVSDERRFRFDLEQAGLKFDDLVTADARERSRKQYLELTDIFLREAEALR